MRKSLTIRDIPANVEKEIKSSAQKNNTSLNKAVINILQEAVGDYGKKSVKHHDLDHLAGTWSKNYTKSFNSKLNK